MKEEEEEEDDDDVVVFVVLWRSLFFAAAVKVMGVGFLFLIHRKRERGRKGKERRKGEKQEGRE